MKIIEHNWDWAHPLSKRTGNPDGVVWHNSGSVHATPEGVHAYHKSLGWCGVAYMFLVQKDGKVHRGRPEWALGGHALGASRWLGVMCEGNYETVDKVMPKAQLKAAQALHAYIEKKYGPLKDIRHKDFPGNSTGCPGKWFPFTKITGAK